MKKQIQRFDHKMIHLLSTRIFQANRTRNVFEILAIILTTLLLTCVFSIGFSFSKNLEAMELREKGTGAQFTIITPTPQQLQKLEELSYLRAVGREINVGVVSFPEKNSEIRVINADDVQWKQHLKPCISDIEGHLPQQKNEVMLSSRALSLLGNQAPKEGQEIRLAISGTSEQSFTLCGWYTEYSANTNGTALLSKAYCDTNGLTVEKDGAAQLSAKKGEKDILPRIMVDIQPTEQQRWFINGTQSTEIPPSPIAMIGIALLILLIMLSGYLLITNVFNLSTAHDIRFYGLLKALGAQKKQIGRIVRKQALFLAGIGIPIGLVTGALACFGIVPLAMRIISTGSDSAYPTEISYQPLIFLGAAMFSLLTVLLGCQRPSKIAQRVSPVAALRRTISGEEKQRSKAARHHHTRCSLKYMAWKNVFRDRRRSSLVVASISLGMVLFLSVSALSEAVGGESYFNAKYPYDFVCTVQNTESVVQVNLTGVIPEPDPADPFTLTPEEIQDILHEIQRTDGISQLDLIRSSVCTIDIDEALWEPVLQKSYVTLPMQTGEPESAAGGELQFFAGITYDDFIEQITDLGQFRLRVYSISDRYLNQYNQTHTQQIDPDAFRRGEVCLISGRSHESMIGEKINLKSPESEKSTGLIVGGIWETPVYSQLSSANTGYLEGIYISDEYMNSLNESAPIDLFCINMKSESVSAMQSQLEAVKTENPNSFTFSSKADSREAEQTTIGTMQILGQGLSGVLLLIGLLNFTNILFGSVVARQREFAIMESIGMTRRQLFHMLIWEGLICTVFCCVIGLAGSSVVYSILAKSVPLIIRYATFSFPFLSAGIMVFVLLVMCLFSTYVIYRYASRHSVVQKLRDTAE